ncbi:pilus assembly FimT family protein [Geomonas azotofigens]|uniref:pilus assembly FimT family protein n=1 Tax=Geomonas azotofigens TaxID=2843196 RepID=UPI001C106829|nr:prepilin-type N-terminal cleavage/methylation domain-containing protein [Geomonas azotofigens]MBU5613306.1 prepilin-type N-terminal cleavage/methylation domain-containing protein [Geomonas azotofigens]
MRSEGFSLVEMMFIVAIVSILAAIGTLRFREYQQRYRTEAQTRQLFTELLNVRTQAIYQRRGKRVKLYANRFEVYSSLQDGGTVNPLQTHPLPYPVTATSNLNLVEGANIDFDETGVTNSWGSICVESVDGNGGFDSVVLSTTRVSIGKRDKGDACETDSITLW